MWWWILSISLAVLGVVIYSLTRARGPVRTMKGGYPLPPNQRLFTFLDKVAVITGCSSGIGESLAYLMAKEGSQYVLSSVSTSHHSTVSL